MISEIPILPRSHRGHSTLTILSGLFPKYDTSRPYVTPITGIATHKQPNLLCINNMMTLTTQTPVPPIAHLLPLTTILIDGNNSGNGSGSHQIVSGLVRFWNRSQEVSRWHCFLDPHRSIAMGWKDGWCPD